MADYIRYVAALAFVIALILGLALLLRRIGSSRLLNGGRVRGEKRLRLIEVQPLDPKRRLVLIAHDDREHLLLLGHERDLVIETGRPAPAHAVTPDTAADSNTLATDQRKTDAQPGIEEQRPTTPRYIPGSRSSTRPDNGS